VAQNVIINEIDCKTLNGITKTTIYKGETVEVELKELIVGRTARDTIRNPITDERSSTRTSSSPAKSPTGSRSEAGVDPRAQPLTCESPRGVCARCYAVDMSTNQLVEEGLAVGIIAASRSANPERSSRCVRSTPAVSRRRLTSRRHQDRCRRTVSHRDINAVR